ncbi:MAG: hypothetical protein JXI33_00095 [Candidatus Aminicenantes bacterium]|nr:hypothetical protein [Candidatus Aminicenantes bacterium]
MNRIKLKYYEEKQLCYDIQIEDGVGWGCFGTNRLGRPCRNGPDVPGKQLDR